MRRVAFFITLTLVALGASLGGAAVPAVADPATPVTGAIRVQVLGAVVHPGDLVLATGSRLSDALAAAGARSASTTDEFTIEAAFGPGSDLRRVFLTRTIDGRPVSRQIDARRSSAESSDDPLLQPGDKIYVPEVRGSSFKVIAS